GRKPPRTRAPAWLGKVGSATTRESRTGGVMRRSVVLAAVVIGALAVVPAAGARVLRVGRYKGIRGQFRSIQAAVDAARPGDWILIGRGDYKTSSSKAPADAKDSPAAVLITTPRLRLRGMN